MKAAAIDIVSNAEVPSESKLSSFLFKALVIAAFAFAIRLIPLILRSGSEWAIANNSDAYMQLALGLSKGCGFAAWLGGKCAAPEISRTPGYPLFLWMLPSWRAALFTQAAISAAMCFLVGLFSYRRWGAGVGLLASILLAVDLPTIVYSNKIMTEVLFTALFTSGFLVELIALYRKTLDLTFWLLTLLASVLLACAILVRPIGEILVLLIAIPAFVIPRETCSRRTTVALVLVSLSVLTIVGWSQRNKQESGIRTFSTVAAFNLYAFRAAGVVAYSSGRSLVDVWSDWPQVKYEDMSSQAIKIMLAHPFATTYMTVRGLLYVSLIPDRFPLAQLLGTETTPQVKDPGSFRLFKTLGTLGRTPRSTLSGIYAEECDSSVAIAALLFVQVATILFVWVGVFFAVRGLYFGSFNDGLCLILILSVGVFLLILASGPEATSRFRIPAMPFLSMVAAVGWIKDRRLKRHFRHHILRLVD